MEKQKQKQKFCRLTVNLKNIKRNVSYRNIKWVNRIRLDRKR